MVKSRGECDKIGTESDKIFWLGMGVCGRTNQKKRGPHYWDSPVSCRQAYID